MPPNNSTATICTIAVFQLAAQGIWKLDCWRPSRLVFRPNSATDGSVIGKLYNENDSIELRVQEILPPRVNLLSLEYYIASKGM